MAGDAQEPRAEMRIDLATELAAERTVLAWIRTGLALMGFGFVVAKFGLFLRRLEQMQSSGVDLAATDRTAYSMWIGVALVLVGVAVNVLSALRHHRLMATLRSGTARPSQSQLAFFIALTLAAVGVGIALYLTRIRP